MLNKTMRRRKNLRCRPTNTQDFAPEPFARIRAATLGQIVRAQFARPRRDLCGLGMSGMVFPQPDLRRQYATELRL